MHEMEGNRQQGEPRARGLPWALLGGLGSLLPEAIDTLHHLVGKASASEAPLHTGTAAGQGTAPPSPASSARDTFQNSVFH